MHLVEAEAAGPSTRLPALEAPPRASRPGSIVGRLHPPSSASPTSGPQQPKLLLNTAAPKASLHQQAAQQQSITEIVGVSDAAVLQSAGHHASLVRFPQLEQTSSAVQPPGVAQSQEWSAAAHVQAIDLLLQAAQAAPGNVQVALQHLLSIRMLCQACMTSVTGIQGMSRAAAPLQSMQSLCSLATAESLQQRHAQEAMWLSLRLLFGQISDILSTK